MSWWIHDGWALYPQNPTSALRHCACMHALSHQQLCTIIQFWKASLILDLAISYMLGFMHNANAQGLDMQGCSSLIRADVP